MSSVDKMSMLLIPLLLLSAACSYADLQLEDNNEIHDDQSESIDGRSFFFFGQIFRRWRDRWLAFHNSPPLYAGPAYPLNGYYNCPPYGCNPTQPTYYPQTVGGGGGFYPTPLQQQQAAQGNSNVYIYQNDPTIATSSGTTYGMGYFGGGPPLKPPSFPFQSPALPAPLPPIGMATASSGGGGYGLGSSAGGPSVACIPPTPANSMACSLG